MDEVDSAVETKSPETPAIPDSNKEEQVTANNEADRSEILSKRAQKKILKLAKYEEIKKLRRQKEREKQKEKRKAEAALGIPGPNKRRKTLKNNKMDESSNTVRVAIDFGYDELMSDKDMAKCAKQLLWVYTENRKSSTPIRLHYTGIREDSKIKQALDRNDGYLNWDVKMHPESYLDIFDHDSIVYLTSESENVLTEIDPNAVYIIGGLVDHNHHKGLSYERAEQKQLKTARLPLSEHITIKTRTVLTIVHVFEILLKVSEGKSWKDTLLEVLPQRKFKIPNNPNQNKKKNIEAEAESEKGEDANGEKSADVSIEVETEAKS